MNRAGITVAGGGRPRGFLPAVKWLLALGVIALAASLWLSASRASASTLSSAHLHHVKLAASPASDAAVSPSEQAVLGPPPVWFLCWDCSRRSRRFHFIALSAGGTTHHPD